MVNTDADGKVVSYTILDKATNQPKMIMEPADFQAFRSAPAGFQALMQLSPQYMYDLSSALTHGMNYRDLSNAKESLSDVVSSKQYWFDAALGVLGVVGTEATSVKSVGSTRSGSSTVGGRGFSEVPEGATPPPKTAVEPSRGLGGTEGHSLAEEVIPGGSGQALAGHGVMNGTDTLFGQGQFVAPAGTTVVMPRPGITIADSTGRVLESVVSVEELNRVIATRVAPNGEMLIPRNLRDLQGYQVILPGEIGPNLTLLHPAYEGKLLKIMENSTTTLNPVRLSDILEPNMGCVFWAACTQPVQYIPK